MLIPSEQLVIQALNHEIRQTILHLVHSRPYSYSELMDILRIDSGKLYYHLQHLKGFLTKQGETTIYSLTSLGEKAVGVMTSLSEGVSVSDIPHLAKAYSHQLSEKKLPMNPPYLRAVIETVDLICKLVIYLHDNPVVPETLNEFIDQIKMKAFTNKRTVMNQIESGALDFEVGTELRFFWGGVYDTLDYIHVSRRKMGKVLDILKHQALELQKYHTKSIRFKKAIPNLQCVVSEELKEFPPLSS
jgi:hypothetical protein